MISETVGMLRKLYVLQNGKGCVTMIAVGRLLFVWNALANRYETGPEFGIWIYQNLKDQWMSAGPGIVWPEIEPKETAIQAVAFLDSIYCPIIWRTNER